MSEFSAPFTYMGGESKAAPLVWSRFGDPATYIEPFFGSGAVLLRRPSKPKHEVINDLDANLVNFWRAVRFSPALDAKIAAYPVDEITLDARHRWLYKGVPELVEHLRTDPTANDVERAAWWVWGISQWLGSEWMTEKGSTSQRIPRVSTKNGINRFNEEEAAAFLTRLQGRLLKVDILHGDWKRAVAPSIMRPNTAIFLDPPYADGNYTYAETEGAAEGKKVTDEVVAWAVEHGDQFRIAVCGYVGTMDFPSSWDAVPWTANGGLSNLGETGNRYRERIWFSPSCLAPLSRFDLE